MSLVADNNTPIDSTITFSALDEIDVDETASQKNPELPQTEFPCFIIENIVFEDELSYFNSQEGLPVYTKQSGKYICVGNIDPNIEFIIKLKFLGMNVKFVKKDGEILHFDKAADYLPFLVI